MLNDICFWVLYRPKQYKLKPKLIFIDNVADSQSYLRQELLIIIKTGGNIMKMNKKKGFTLVELIVVVVILGILMGIGAMKYSDVKKTANLRVLQTNHRTLSSAIQMKIAEDGGVIPETITDADLVKMATGIKQGTPVGAEYKYTKPELKTTVNANDVGSYPSGKTLTITTNFETGETIGLEATN